MSSARKAERILRVPQLLARNVDRLPIDRIVTHRMPLEQAAEALELAQADGAMKVVLDPRL